MQLSKCCVLFSMISLSASIGCGGAGSSSVDVDTDLMNELLGPEENSEESAFSLRDADGSDDDEEQSERDAGRERGNHERAHRHHPLASA